VLSPTDSDTAGPIVAARGSRVCAVLGVAGLSGEFDESGAWRIRDTFGGNAQTFAKINPTGGI